MCGWCVISVPCGWCVINVCHANGGICACACVQVYMCVWCVHVCGVINVCHANGGICACACVQVYMCVWCVHVCGVCMCVWVAQHVPLWRHLQSIHTSHITHTPFTPLKLALQVRQHHVRIFNNTCTVTLQANAIAILSRSSSRQGGYATRPHTL